MSDRPGGRPREILVIHHSHTDVGYTAPQSTVADWHADFIRQALRICADHPDFRWTCETFWGVEQFLSRADELERIRFEEALMAGCIGLSASYLNFNELLDYPLLRQMTARAVQYGRSIGVAVDSAMTADINGFGWGFARALHDNGVENLFTCIHTHHGMYPLGRRHVGFWWEGPSGGKVLVFSGEHYHFGNELGLVPGAVSSYIIKDECDADMIYTDHWGVAEIRIERFLQQLGETGYPYDFVPVMASGLRTDNAPPNAAILDCIDRWNDAHGDIAHLRMATLGEFFELLRHHAHDLPTYRGDWPDWWTDGVASFPAATKLFRQAQRNYHEYLRLNDQETRLPELEQDCALYAEHTFSHADSVSRPWDHLVHAISARKVAYAASALDRSVAAIECELARRGGAPLSADRPAVYRVVNPWPHTVADHVELFVGHYEYHERGFQRGVLVRNRSTGERLAGQCIDAPGGAVVVLFVELKRDQSIDLQFEACDQQASVDSKPRDHPDRIDTPYVEITWRRQDGITTWRDKIASTDLLREDRKHAPFSPIHERTPAPTPEDITRVRGEMGLNRKGADVRRSLGRLVDATITADGAIVTKAELRYEATGMSFYAVELCAYHREPRVDVAVRMAKDHLWEPENVYLALPFCPGPRPFVTWLDKGGAAVRPRIDQLPGTLIDYYCLQEGLAMITDDFGIAIAIPDAPLIHLGDVEHRPRLLHDPRNPQPNSDQLFSWLMTNYWETNFAAGLGGFYEFRYFLRWGRVMADPDAALAACREMNAGLRAFIVLTD